VAIYSGANPDNLPGLRFTVRDVRISGLVGSGGFARNGGVKILDSKTAPLASRISDINIEASLQVGGSVTHDGVNAHGLYMNAGTRIKVKLSLRITDTQGAFTRFTAARISNSVESDFDITCPALPALGGVRIVHDSGAVQNRDNSISGSLTGAVGQTVGHIFLQDAPNTTLGPSLKLLGIQSGLSGLQVGPHNIASSTTVQAVGVTVRKAVGATGTVGFNSAATGRIGSAVATACDFSGVDTPLSANFATEVSFRNFQGNRSLANAST
jgi:hypothetical protein